MSYFSHTRTSTLAGPNQRTGHVVRTFQASGPPGGEVFDFVALGEVVEGPNGGAREDHAGQALRTRPLREGSGVN